MESAHVVTSHWPTTDIDTLFKSTAQPSYGDRIKIIIFILDEQNLATTTNPIVVFLPISTFTSYYHDQKSNVEVCTQSCRDNFER
jgi:hypothetical protein